MLLGTWFYCWVAGLLVPRRTVASMLTQHKPVFGTVLNRVSHRTRSTGAPTCDERGFCKWTAELELCSAIFNNNAANWTMINMALTWKIASSTAAGFRPVALWVGKRRLVLIQIPSNILGVWMKRIAASARMKSGRRENCYRTALWLQTAVSKSI